MIERKQKVLVVEDDEAIMMGLEENLKFAGYEVLKASDGLQALKTAEESNPDLIVLDIMLPGMSGYEVCRELRDKSRQMPIIMLTAKQDEFDKLHGFEMGADDYLTKPFSISELLARIKAILARTKAGMGKELRKYKFGDFMLDPESRTLLKKGKEVFLTKTEFDLLVYFCKNEGKALSREKIMNDVWSMEYFGIQRSIDTFIAGLRTKIEKRADRPRHIHTVRGVGYKFLKKANLCFFLILLTAASLIIVGCEEAQEAKTLIISPSEANLSPSNTTTTFTVGGGTNSASSGLGELSLPLEWLVSKSELGSIEAAAGYSALYIRTEGTGVNIVTARDQYGAEGFATVIQE